jgi:peroxiredoxin
MKALALVTLLLSQANPPTLAPGAAAPDFDLPGVDGKRYSLKDFASAKLLCVVFTTNHCPTAIAYEGRLKKLVSDYQEKGVAFVAINPNDPLALRLDEMGYTDLDDTFESMKIRARDAKFNLPYLHDGEKQEAAKAYGATATPHAFLFDADRKLRYTGRIDDKENEAAVQKNDLREAIDELLAGREVALPKTRAHGCSLKWSNKRGEVAKYMERISKLPVSLDPADADTVKALRKNDSGKVRVIHAYANPHDQLADLAAVWHCYNKRSFELITVCARGPEARDDFLDILKKNPASHRNLICADAATALGVPVTREEPCTLVLGPEGETLYEKKGAYDPLALRRAIVSKLKDNRAGK